MMRNILSAFTLLAVVSMSHAQEKEPYEQVKLSVIESLKRGAGSPASCDLLRDALAKDPENEKKKKMTLGFCDSDIDFSKPVSFSEIYQHEFEKRAYVCGIISGETKLGRKIGVRFISAEPYHLIIGTKYSRRPLAYATDDDFVVYEYLSQLRSFNELNKKYCQ
ncbi:hypothetical protein [Dickeya zeae]|jgi:hypothetical protein|uniref:hypothetical protein n=2 Tax=Dickeya zeae TaxID=204042 RepID=UPI0006ACC6A1|nr:hypothetical protein [Dickeya zeae]MCA6987114.1 hypothetical protein [Dickeya zeae]PXW48226.1 hypothetical protein DFO54_102317 [Erwinia sp. AG740]UJR54680.1 hypothetical protein J417_11885 [Dickeya zeae MS1]